MATLEDIDFTAISPVLWKEGDIAKGFKCARSEFKTYLQGKRIHRDRVTNMGQCWVLKKDGSIAGYITLLGDKLDIDSAQLLPTTPNYSQLLPTTEE